MRDPAVLQHTGAGRFSIINYNPNKTYQVFNKNGTPNNGIPIVDGVIQMGTNYGDYKVSFVTTPSKGTPFSRAAVTYYTAYRQVCVGTPGACSPACESGGGYTCCWGCSPAADGTICCCPGGTTCSQQPYAIKNAVPAGYTEAFGEWVKIDNPEVRGIITTTNNHHSNGVVPFSSVGVWEPTYYQAFETPERTLAPIETTEFNPDPPMELVFDYNIILSLFDDDDELYLSLDSNNTPESFQFVKGETQEVFVRDIQGIQTGRFEMIWAGTDEANPIIKEVSGRVGG